MTRKEVNAVISNMPENKLKKPFEANVFSCVALKKNKKEKKVKKE